jgi:polygalacturonase
MLAHLWTNKPQSLKDGDSALLIYRGWLLRIAVVLAFSLLFAVWATAALNVRDYGAKGDGLTKDTVAIQAAIDAAEKQGGGDVHIPPGRYISGTIHLKSNVTLYLEAGATLAESPDNADFDSYEVLPFKSVSDNETTYFHYGLVTADSVHNIGIVGQGTIDGNRTYRHGPKTIALKLCQYVTIQGITVQNSPNYSVSFWGCDYVNVIGVTVLNSYADGIDPDASRYVRIANCYVESADDAICPKASPSMGYARPTEHLTVTNCVLRTNANNFKFGTESSGDFKNVAASNLVMLPRDKGHPPHSGISLEAVDGAHIEGVVISNISMEGVLIPIFIRRGNRGRGLTNPVPGTIRNVSIQNVVATGATGTSDISGLPGYPVERVLLDGINITLQGGGKEAKTLDVPENPDMYPEAGMFGILPAYGFYARHVEGLTLSNVQVRWENADVRPAMVLDDVKTLDVSGFRAGTATGAQPIVWMNDVVDALVRASHPAPSETFLRLSGAKTKDIRLLGNDLSNAQRSIEFQDVPKSAVTEVGNFTSGGKKEP